LVPQLKEKRFFLFFHTYQVHNPHNPEPKFLAMFNELNDSIKLAVLEGHHLCEGHGCKYETIVEYIINKTNLSSSQISEGIKRLVEEGTIKVFKSRNRSLYLLSDWNNKKNKRHIINLYDADVRQMDYYLGKFLSLIKKYDLWNHSIIILTADHGEAFFDAHNNNHTLDISHCHLYEPVIRIPLIIYYPNIKPSINDVRVSSLDILPTVLNLIKLQYDSSSFMGKSIFSNEQSPVKLFFVEQFRLGGLKAVITPQYKYILHLSNKSEELYDIESDPYEYENLAKNETNVTALFRQALMTFNTTPGTFIYKIKDHLLLKEHLSNKNLAYPDFVNLSEKVINRLGRLGYLD